jgi:hypothetical protein
MSRQWKPFLCVSDRRDYPCTSEPFKLLVLRLQLPGFSHAGAMVKRRRSDPPKKEDNAWAKEQFERETAANRRMPPRGVAVSNELFGEYLERAHAKATASVSAAASSSSSSSAAAHVPSHVSLESFRTAAYQVHRHSALLVSGFEPQRHTMFVEGRPTQAAT